MSIPTLAEGTTIRISTASNGSQGNNNCGQPSLSADGRYVAFSSDASNLVAGDTNGAQDIFLHDTVTGATTRISTASNGSQGNNNCWEPSLSADGRYVAFTSSASNLVAGDSNGREDIFIYDTVTGATTRISVASDGSQGNHGSDSPSLSANGRYVAFNSSASNLVAGDSNGREDIFIYDTVTGATTRVSVASDGSQGNNHSSSEPSLSADGRYVAFQSSASNLVAGDSNGREDIFIYDTVTGATTRASVASDGSQGNGYSWEPSLSADGRYVVFQSYASNLVAGDTNGIWDIFLHDTVTGTTTRVSVASDGSQGNGGSYSPSLSADGRYVAFHSYASNLVAEDSNGREDVFIYDTVTGATTRVSVTSDGSQGNHESESPSLSADGRYVAFHSYASNLVAGDTNGTSDIFLHVLQDGGTPPEPNLPLTDIIDAAGGTYGLFADLAKAAYQLGDNEPLGWGDSEPQNIDDAWSHVTEHWAPLGHTELGIPSSGQNPYELSNTWFLEDSGIYYCANAAALVLHCADAVVISFRGTDDYWDMPNWVGMPAYYDELRPLIEALDAYVDSNNIGTVLVTGHSLGGAMALGYMQDHPDTQSVQYEAITFAAPAFLGGTEPETDDRIIQIEVNGDPVPDITDAPGVEAPGYTLTIDAEGLGYLPISTSYHSMDLYLAIAKAFDQYDIDFEFDPDDLGHSALDGDYKVIRLVANEESGTAPDSPVYSIGSLEDFLVSNEIDLYLDDTVDQLLIGGPLADELQLFDLGAAYGGGGSDTYAIHRNSDARFELYDSGGGHDILQVWNDTFSLLDIDSTDDLDVWIDGNDLLIEIHVKGLLLDDDHEGLIRIHDQAVSANRIEELQILNDVGFAIATVSLQSVWNWLEQGGSGIPRGITRLEFHAVAAFDAPQTVFQITLSDVQGPYGTLVLDDLDAVVYEDDVVYQSPPGYEYTLSASTSHLSEGDASLLTVTVMRSGDTDLASSIDFRLEYSGADSSDVVLSLPVGTISFAAGETSKDIQIGAADDTLSEGTERFAVRLFDAGAPDAVVGMKWFDIADNEVSLKTYGNDAGGLHTGTDGPDTFILGEGNDTVVALGDGDTITDTAGDDVIYGGPGNDSIDAGTGNDLVVSGDGDDTIIGDGDGSLLRGGTGNDAVAFTGADGTLQAGQGFDLIDATLGTNCVLRGGLDDDTLLGGSGSDSIYGGKGDDSILGGAGNDFLSGLLGNDTMLGGDGTDTFVYLGNNLEAGGHDTTDASAGDFLSLAPLIYGYTINGIALANLVSDTAVGNAINATNSIAFNAATHELRFDVNGNGAFNAADDFFVTVDVSVASVTFNASGDYLSFS